MSVSDLTPSMIRANASEESYRRGQDYFGRGAVLTVKRQGVHRLEAYVKGSQVLPYTVHIQHDAEGISDVACTCPFHAGSWCKHIVAVLLAWLDHEASDAARPDVAVLLDGLDREALVHLLEQLVEQEPGLADVIERIHAGRA